MVAGSNVRLLLRRGQTRQDIALGRIFDKRYLYTIPRSRRDQSNSLYLPLFILFGFELMHCLLFAMPARIYISPQVYDNFRF